MNTIKKQPLENSCGYTFVSTLPVLNTETVMQELKHLFLRREKQIKLLKYYDELIAATKPGRIVEGFTMLQYDECVNQSALLTDEIGFYTEWLHDHFQKRFIDLMTEQLSEQGLHVSSPACDIATLAINFALKQLDPGFIYCGGRLAELSPL